MEQRDYILREIEKIGAMLSALLFGVNYNSIKLETQIENAKEMMLNETNFDLYKFLDFNTEEANKYICGFKEFNNNNIELLANCLFQIGFSDNCDNPQKYLEKSLQLYELCNTNSQTFSFERETNIKEIKNAL